MRRKGAQAVAATADAAAKVSSSLPRTFEKLKMEAGFSRIVGVDEVCEEARSEEQRWRLTAPSTRFHPLLLSCGAPSVAIAIIVVGCVSACEFVPIHDEPHGSRLWPLSAVVSALVWCRAVWQYGSVAVCGSV
jgi:hypothetical protein